MLWWCQRFSGNLLFELHCQVPSTVEPLLCPCCLYPTPPTLRLVHKAHDDPLTCCCCCSLTVCCWTAATAFFCIHIDSAADSVLLQLVNHMGCSFLNIYCCFMRCSCQALLRRNHGWNRPDPHVLRLARSIISRGKQFLGIQFAKEEEEEMNSTRTQCNHICENLHQMQLLLNNPTHPKQKKEEATHKQKSSVISDRDLHANTSNGFEAKEKVLSSHHWTSSSTKRHYKQQQQQQQQQPTNYTSPQLLHSH